MKILIVDDSKMLRDRLRESLLDVKGVDVVGEALNGIEALHLIKDKTPDVVIMDIRMPEMNGITVLEKMKELKIKSTVCIFTNYPYIQYKQKCLNEGADYFFDKNYGFQELVDNVRRLSLL